LLFFDLLGDECKIFLPQLKQHFQLEDRELFGFAFLFFHLVHELVLVLNLLADALFLKFRIFALRWLDVDR